MRLVLTLQPRLVARRVPGDRTFVGILELSISLCTHVHMLSMPVWVSSLSGRFAHNPCASSRYGCILTISLCITSFICMFCNTMYLYPARMSMSSAKVAQPSQTWPELARGQ